MPHTFDDALEVDLPSGAGTPRSDSPAYSSPSSTSNSPDPSASYGPIVSQQPTGSHPVTRGAPQLPTQPQPTPLVQPSAVSRETHQALHRCPRCISFRSAADYYAGLARGQAQQLCQQGEYIQQLLSIIQRLAPPAPAPTGVHFRYLPQPTHLAPPPPPPPPRRPTPNSLVPQPAPSTPRNPAQHHRDGFDHRQRQRQRHH